MLSQRITKDAFMIKENIDVKSDLENCIKVFDITLKALKDGGKAPLDLKWEIIVTLPPSKGEIKNQLEKVNAIWNKFKEHAERFISNANDVNLKFITENNLSLLNEMNTAVVMMQKDSEAKTNLLKLLSLIMLFISIGFVTFTIFFYLGTIIRPVREMVNGTRNLQKAKWI